MRWWKCTAATGFRVRTLFILRTSAGVDVLNRGVSTAVAGSWQFDQGAANGSVTSFNTFTDAGGRLTVTNGRVPAQWQFIRGPIPPCPTIAALLNITPGQEIVGACILIGVDNLTASPNPLDSQLAPQPFQISGGSFDTTYGMPKVEYFDDFGNWVGEATATSVSGGVMYGVTPDLGALYDGFYTLMVSNATADGWQAIGYTAVYTVGNPEPPPPDPDPCPLGLPGEPLPECGPVS